MTELQLHAFLTSVLNGGQCMNYVMKYCK